MKTAYSLLVLIATIGLAHAGGFGGPPPFTNGSPLQSGTDGQYQAVATATNVTGIFSFQISNGFQTSTTANNSWVFFIDGNVLTGTTDANISNDKVAGVLDAGDTNTQNITTLPAVIYIPGNEAAGGSFSGDIDLNSPIAAFEGEGVLQGVPDRVDQLIAIDEFGFVTTVAINIPGSTFDRTDFKFRGSRVNTGATN